MVSDTGTTTLNGYYNGTNGIDLVDELDDASLRGDHDTERSLLANVLADPDLAYQAIAQLDPEDFRESGHAALFGAIKSLAEEGLPIQASDVRDEMIRQVGLPFSEASALSIIHIAGDLLLTPATFWKALAEMKRRRALRRLFDAMPRIIDRARSGIDAPGQLFAVATEILRDALPVDGEDIEDTPYNPGELGPEPDLGWLATYADTISAMTSSPRSFNLLIALLLGATAIKGKAVLHMSFGPVRPNLYGALIGKSTVYHKSTAVAKGQEVLAAAQLDGLQLPDTGTSEGLIAALAERSHGLIVRDEVARLFASDRIKYMQGYKQDLTALFDGGTFRKRLSGTDLTIASPYVSILGATTPARFYDAVGDRDWDDGFLVRWLFALPDCEPDFDAPSPAMMNDAEYSGIMARLAAPLRELAAHGETSFAFGAGAFDAWDTWRRDGLRRAHEYGDDQALAITGRISTAALKIAQILAAVNGRWGHISAETMHAAIYLADLYRLNTWQLLTERSKHGVGGHKLAKALDVIARRGGAAGCTRSTVMRYANMKSHELRPVLDKLMQLGAVIESDDGRRLRAVHTRLPAKAYV